MVVGCLKIDFDEIKKFVKHPVDIVAYCDNLVPSWCRHVEPIVMNQRYYMAINIRGMLTIPFKQRMELVELLIRGVTVTGVMAHFIEIHEIIEACDRDKFIRVLEDYLKNEKEK